MVELGLTLYLVLFAALFFSLFTTRSNSVADFGGVGRLSSILMNLASKTLVAYVGLKMLKWLHLL
jgi:hypothetical protein